MQNTKMKYAIVYTGAPYADGEEGHIVSRHMARDTADARWDRDYSGTTGIYNHRIVRLDQKAE